MNKTNNQTVELSFLKPGEKFQIPSVRETMRDMTLISTTDTSSLVEGYRRDGVNEPWKHFRMHISNGVFVLPVNAFEKSMENTEQATAPAAQATSTEVVNPAPKRRGRPPKVKVALNQLKGVEGEFTVKDIVSQNGLKDYEVHNLIRGAVKSGGAKVVKELIGGRGKPRKVYRLA